jgi:phosphoserine phosphatase RsbX
VSEDLVVEYQSRPKLGETANGDVVVVRYGRGGTLVALVDALGHGPRAVTVAERASAYLCEVADALLESDAENAMRGLHGALHGTRGAAATICLIRGWMLDACGVGNVEVRCVGATIPVVMTPGIVGVQMQRLRSFTGTLPAGARCFMFSDGVSRQAPFSGLASLNVRQACETLIANHCHAHDDASVVVLARKEQSPCQNKRRFP